MINSDEWLCAAAERLAGEHDRPLAIRQSMDDAEFGRLAEYLMKTTSTSDVLRDLATALRAARVDAAAKRRAMIRRGRLELLLALALGLLLGAGTVAAF